MSWPLSPSNGQQVLINGIVYAYDSANAVWNRVFATTSVGGGITTAVTVTQSSQPNITSVGTMVSLTATGNIQGGNLIGTHANGNSNIAIAANANVTISVAGNANILTVTGTGVNVAGTFNIGSSNANVGNLGVATDANIGGNLVVAGNVVVSGSTTTVNSTTTRVVDPIIEQGGSANGGLLGVNDGKDRGQLLHYYSSGAVDAFMGYKNSTGEFILASNVTVTSEVVAVNTYGNLHVGNANLGNLTTANFFSGSGNLLANIQGANVSGQSPNSLVAGTVYTAAQPNITSVGTLVSANITGNISSGNANLGNLVVANYFSGALTGSATTAITVTANSQPNITSVGTLTSLTSGLITATSGGVKVGNIQDPSGTNTISLLTGNVTMIGNLRIGTGGTGNVTATNANLGNLVTANYLSGTLITGAQPNITSLTSTSGVSVTGTLVMQQSQEKFAVLTGATGLVAHDFLTGGTFYHTSVSANFTCGVTNFDSTSSRVSVVAVVIEQGSTAYYPNNFSISTTATANTTTQTIKWSGGSSPSPTASKTEVFVFTVFNNSGAYNVLGQLASYG